MGQRKGNIVHPYKSVSALKDEGVLIRNLLVGFYHGLGLESDYHGGLDPKEYRFHWAGPVSSPKSKGSHTRGATRPSDMGKKGNFVWEPKASNIANIEDQAITGEQSFGTEMADSSEFSRIGGSQKHRGRAAHWAPEYSSANEEWSEQVKKSTLPTVAWNDAEYSGEFLNLGSMRARGDDKGGNFDTAKRYVWRWIANRKSGWGGGPVPNNDALALFEDYMREVMEESAGQRNAEANKMLKKLMESISGNFAYGGNVLKVQEAPSTGAGAPEELGLRLWPYINGNLSNTSDIGQIVLDASRDIERAIETNRDIYRASPVPGAEAFDISSDMLVFQDIESALVGAKGFDELQKYVEVTEEPRRIYKRFKGRGEVGAIDWHDASARAAFAQWMDDQITAQVLAATEKGQGPLSRPKGNDQTGFEYQAARRYMDYGFGSLPQGGSYTWIESVGSGLGLYNVFLQPFGTNKEDLVQVEVGFLPTNAESMFQQLVIDAGVNSRYRELRGQLGNLYGGNNFQIFRRGYQAILQTRLRTTAGFTNIGARSAQAGNRTMFQTYASIVPADKLVKHIFEWVTLKGWQEATDMVSNAVEKPNRYLRGWQEDVYKQIAKFGQDIGKKVAPGKYESWVRDSLTMSRSNLISEDGTMETKPYGKLGSKKRFTDFLGAPYAYQPKPFAWMKSVTGQGPR